jgi:glucose-6-phosphate isomerase
MEVNGKSRDRWTASGSTTTLAGLLGRAGTNGQHSFYQLIHQGTLTIPVDFIAFAQSLNPLGDHHDYLTSNVFAQGEALAFGKTADQVRSEGTRKTGAVQGVRGQPPVIDVPDREAAPVRARQLVALYEHSVFTQGAVWSIGSFDQWGWSWANSSPSKVIPELQAIEDPDLQHDSSTNELIKRYRAARARLG